MAVLLLQLPSGLFDAATKVTSGFALGAFGIAGVVAIIRIAAERKGAQRRIPALAWVVLIVAIVIPVAGSIIRVNPPDPYKVTVVAVDSGGVVSDAQITSVPAYPSTPVGHSLLFDIPAPSVHSGDTVTFYARDGTRTGHKTLDLTSQRTVTVSIRLPGNTPVVRTEIESNLTSGGFVPSDRGHQVPGCDCGPTVMEISPPNMVVNVDDFAQFTWDSRWICQGQGLRNQEGHVSWDGRTTDSLPDSFGTAKVRYPRPGDYLVNFDYSAYCLDSNNGGARCWPGGNYCRASGVARIRVK